MVLLGGSECLRSGIKLKFVSYEGFGICLKDRKVLVLLIFIRGIKLKLRGY